jgi:hypothetical protein
VSITLLPTPPSRQDPANFAFRADAFLGALPTFGTEANALATTVNNNAVAAAASATAAAASYDSFDDRYLGSKTTNPTLDNDGNTLLVGAIYWNSTSSEMRAWNGTAWVAVQSTTAATNAAASATAAATSATNAASSATAAASSATAAAASYDSFDDRYLGAKSSNPTLDNDGNALLVGAIYWNTSNNEMRVWNGTSWTQISVVVGVSSFNTRNGAVTLTSADVTNVLSSSSNFTAGTITATTVNAANVSSSTITAATVNATNLNSTSDAALKSNVQGIDPKLLQAIEPVSFTWKSTGEKSYGVIAQQLQQVLPELVHRRDDGFLSVSYIPIIAMLVQAVQELQAKVDDLEQK